ncbi:SDR family NAD(P)-dependent oxidoreductase [Chelatococcus sp. GCM10030263]|uniref:SDR family NAD(P)-dependent oxidoreductase n=1 Tax=Chelatococcus sp. GCM10030263 TaxID=3273387 RepID=UPI00361DC405
MGGNQSDAGAVLVTGAGRGIGRAIAMEVAAAGYPVVVADIDGSTAERTADEIIAAGRNALAVSCDVTAKASCEAAVAAAVARFAKLYGAICNAGVIQVKHVLEIEESDWDPIFAVNTKGAFFTAQAAGRQMLSQQTEGRVIFIASVAGRYGAGPVAPLIPHYRASKAAVISLAQTLAQSFAPHVRVNAVCPGMIATDMWQYIDQVWGEREGWAPGEAMRRRATANLLNRSQSEADVAGVVSFLLSDKAGYITGQTINVDAGVAMN